MNDIRLIAFDLDGTLLTTNKELTRRTRAALCAAADAGIHLVPTTGRIFMGLPEEIREMPFIRYAICANGAAVFDRTEGKDLYSAEIPVEKAVEVMSWLDQFDVLYDCYMDNQGWMTESMWDKAPEYASIPYLVSSIRRLRHPVPELKAFLREYGGSVQKIQSFQKTVEMQHFLIEETGRRFPELAVSTSVLRNVEINHADANKGKALLVLAEKLGLCRRQTMAFGDGLNDVSMIREAGSGVAMSNACDAVLAVADRVTLSNDEDGVAAVIEELLA